MKPAIDYYTPTITQESVLYRAVRLHRQSEARKAGKRPLRAILFVMAAFWTVVIVWIWRGWVL